DLAQRDGPTTDYHYLLIRKAMKEREIIHDVLLLKNRQANRCSLKAIGRP
ncbi:MAG: hypothetical protein ACI9D8_000814, partial [Reinekea sp.]